LFTNRKQKPYQKVRIRQLLQLVGIYVDSEHSLLLGPCSVVVDKETGLPGATPTEDNLVLLRREPAKVITYVNVDGILVGTNTEAILDQACELVYAIII
jgi:hypothetical protein